MGKGEEQIHGVVESTAGLYGDLQGIAGRSLLEIDGLELPLLDGPARDAAERWVGIRGMELMEYRAESTGLNSP